MRRAALLSLAMMIVTPALADDPPVQSRLATIVIEGEASADVVPDTATVSLGVVTDRPRASDAIGENGRAVATVVASIRAGGVDAKDIATTEIGLTPVFEQPKSGSSSAAPRIVGYEARNALTFKVRLGDGLGALLGKLVDDGANAVDGLSFSNADEAAVHDRLRGEAARDARREAEIYAGGLGLKLGRVLDITPQQSAGFQPQGATIARRAAPVPIEAGQRRLTERVSVTFELVP